MNRFPDDQLSWSPVAILPNVSFKNDFGTEYASVVGTNSEKLTEAHNASEKLRQLTEGFRDQFGNSVEVSLICFSDRYKDRHRNGWALLAFRDIVNISFVLRGNARVCRSRNRFGAVTWSDAFEIFPWMLGRDLNRLYANTASFVGVHDAEKFSGQSSPHLAHLDVDLRDSDHFMFSSLMKLWRKRFVQKRGVRANEADRIFRSLEMAFQASRIPQNYRTTHYDIGRLVALWVSAFEILLNDHQRHVNEKYVVNYLKSCRIVPDGIKKRKYKWDFGIGGIERVSLIEAACRSIYKIRNDYLHGNTIVSGGQHQRFEVSLLMVAQLVYWFALSEKLREIGFDPAPVCRNLNEVVTVGLDYQLMKDEYENALLMSKKRRK